MLKQLAFITSLLIDLISNAQTAQNTLSSLPNYVKQNSEQGSFKIAAPQFTAKIIVDPDEWKCVTDPAKVLLGILPTQDVNPSRGLRIAVSIDNENPIIIDTRKGYHDEFKEYKPENLKRSKILKPLPELGHNYALLSHDKPRRTEVFDNQRWLDATLDVKTAGIHILKIYMVDPEVVLERIIVNPNDKYPSYLGAPERY